MIADAELKTAGSLLIVATRRDHSNWKYLANEVSKCLQVEEDDAIYKVAMKTTVSREMRLKRIDMRKRQATVFNGNIFLNLILIKLT